MARRVTHMVQENNFLVDWTRLSQKRARVHKSAEGTWRIYYSIREYAQDQGNYRLIRIQNPNEMTMVLTLDLPLSVLFASTSAATQTIHSIVTPQL